MFVRNGEVAGSIIVEPEEVIEDDFVDEPEPVVIDDEPQPVSESEPEPESDEDEDEDEDDEDDDEPEPVVQSNGVEPPPHSALKAEWVEFAVTHHGANRSIAETLTKDNLIARYGG
jgi:hypothetical protein